MLFTHHVCICILKARYKVGIKKPKPGEALCHLSVHSRVPGKAYVHVVRWMIMLISAYAASMQKVMRSVKHALVLYCKDAAELRSWACRERAAAV